ncbi:DUF2809 domain-containing protein [Cellulomonas sp. NPDC089187]|uniref:ribosomal maturation YjgA family protein n=1 Tax=Cellulomonas sp. NPDC089187 TaxID=3154970 RepID=UPI003423582F
MTRTRAAFAAALVVVVGLAVTRGGSGPWADAIGDGLYAAMAVLLVRVLAPRSSWRWQLAIGLGWCVLVELAQLTGVPGTIVDAVPLARLVLGTTFVATDLVAYTVGALVCAGVIVASSRLRPGCAQQPDGSKV